MNAIEFINKWRHVQLTERSACQQHFLDLCDLFGHPKPVEVDKTGESFTFEKGAKKQEGGDGWADVWKRDFFGWEYKKKHANLDKAYAQLLRYRESLENPPLLVVSDMDRIVIHGNFTNAVAKTHTILLEDLADTAQFEILHSVFHDPERLRPGRTRETITARAAKDVADIAQSLRQRGHTAEDVAQFLDRIVFCMFAEDIDLLKNKLFSDLLEKSRRDPERFKRRLKQLFSAMAVGGDYGNEEVYRFNGNLFSGAETLDLTHDEIEALHKVSKLDWSAIDPSIFGTLFERGLDPDKRSLLGAHYTHRDDIHTIVEPVVMAPLRGEWERQSEAIQTLVKKYTELRRKADLKQAPKTAANLRRDAHSLVGQFLDYLASIRILDPACGSGNFLYVALQMLKDLERQIIVWAAERDLGPFVPQVSPSQLLGIETSRYAYDLAQMTVWIGYIQWTRGHGYTSHTNPVLDPMKDNFFCKDAVLDETVPDQPCIPQWPEVDFIVGNPPFLGGKLLRRDLGDTYVDRLFDVWKGRVPAEADYCCYWFEQARQQIAEGKCRRAGLLATQGIRGGTSREVLKQIKESGDIFFAESDRPWILDGANVHVSMVGFDDSTDETKTLNGATVASINPNLTTGVDLTTAKPLTSNAEIAFMGDTKGGPFDIAESLALEFLHEPNAHGRPNSDVILPWVNGDDLTGRSRSMWIIDFPLGCMAADAALYQKPFDAVEHRVKPKRASSRTTISSWWLHERPRPDLRAAIAPLPRFLVTIAVAKHRLFGWMQHPTLPDHAVFAFAKSDDQFFGILHSRAHEVWALAAGTQLETRPRYTPNTCFLTFPFPDVSVGQAERISDTARDLDTLREEWLNPGDWTREEILQFPGSTDGPWSKFLRNPDARGIGTVRYPRIIPKNAAYAVRLQERTLTNLYNARPTWLANAHAKLDEAVFDAYGWPLTLSDEEVLERLLALNLEFSQIQTAGH